MRTFVAFVAVFGLSLAASEDQWKSNSDLWNKEFDLVDLSQMNIKDTFDAWKVAFDRSYADEKEEYTKFATFVENLQYIARYNSGTNTAKLGPNQFTDMTSDEFVNYIHGGADSCLLRKDAPKSFTVLNGRSSSKHVDANPAAVDWVSQGKVTPVKNQGQCGSCWAFSATGSTECQYAINKGTLNSLSEQQLVDCSFAEGNLGCSGGQMDAAFKYIEKNGGLCSESEYAYKASRGTCKASSCGTKYNPVTGYSDVTHEDESALETAVAAGCVSVAIEADQRVFQSYSSGIITGSCGTSLDHGVLVVGYGSDSGTEYWKVKNSWGKTWGESGYVRICKNCGANGKQGECGINDDPSFPKF